MQCVTLENNGTLQAVNANPDGSCPSYLLLNASDYALMVQSYTITPEQVLAVFSWGFGVVLFFWSLGYAVGVAKSVINKL